MASSPRFESAKTSWYPGGGTLCQNLRQASALPLSAKRHEGITKGPRSTRSMRPSRTSTRYSVSPTPTRNRVERKRPRRRRTGSPFTSSGSFSSTESRLREPRRLHELRAVGGFDGGKARPLVARERKRHFDAGGAERPDLAVELRERGDLPIADGQDHITLADAHRVRGPLRRKTDHHDPAFGLGGIDAEPGPRRPRHAAIGEEVLQDRL